jgi:hypothetical protein
LGGETPPPEPILESGSAKIRLWNERAYKGGRDGRQASAAGCGGWIEAIESAVVLAVKGKPLRRRYASRWRLAPKIAHNPTAWMAEIVPRLSGRGVAMSKGHAAESPASQAECVAFVRRLRRSYARFGPGGMTASHRRGNGIHTRFEPTATILVHQFAEAHTAYADVCISSGVARPVANACVFDLQMLNVLANPARRVDPIFRMYFYAARSFS